MQPSNILVTRPVVNTLDDSDPRYRCCCNGMHVRIGAIVIGILEIFGSLSNIGGLLGSQAQGQSTGLRGSLYYGIVGAIITIVLVALMFYGISKESHWLVLPHLIAQIIGISGMFIGAILLIIMIITAGAITASKEIDSGTQGAMWGVIVFAIIALFISGIIEIWFFFVILKLYRYYREKSYSPFISITQYGQPQAFVQYGQPQTYEPQQPPPQQPPPSYNYSIQGYNKYP